MPTCCFSGKSTVFAPSLRCFAVFAFTDLQLGHQSRPTWVVEDSMMSTRPYVLVVDDLTDAADSMAALLAIWGYDAEAKYCGDSALAAMHARRPAVVLLDIGMAPMDGFTFAAHVRELAGCERTNIVAISGYTSDDYLARARELGIVEYLFKPADLSQLHAILCRLLPHPLPLRSLTIAPLSRAQRPLEMIGV